MNREDFPTAERTVTGENIAMRIAKALLAQSQWFEVMPLPDDVWRITVKAENDALLARMSTCEETKCRDGVVLVTISGNEFGHYEVQRCERCQRFNDNNEAVAHFARAIGMGVI